MNSENFATMETSPSTESIETRSPAEVRLDDIQQAVASVSEPSSDQGNPAADVGGTSIGEAGGRRDIDSGQRSLLDCLEQIITAPRRRSAIDALTRRIAFECPGTSVRIAVGRRRIDQFYDSRLGWLPRGNSVRDEAGERFEMSLRDRDLSRRFLIAPANVGGAAVPATTADPSLPSPGEADQSPDQMSAEPVAKAPYHCIDLSPPSHDRDELSTSTGQTCILLMRAQSGDQTFIGPPDWLIDGAGTLASALASRPRWTMPKWVDFIGSRPLATMMVTLFVIAGFGLWPVDYPVACTAVVAPTHSRLVASPFDATLLTTMVTPGQRVQRGQPLVQLDGRPMRIELDGLESEIRAAEKDANIALATGRIAEGQRAQLERNKLLHRRDLLQSRLDQLAIVAPTDGVVMGGDLRRHVGSPLTVGQTLMEIAPIDSVAIEVEIPEFEINLIRRNAKSRMRFDAVGGTSSHASLVSIDPRAELRDNKSVFVGRLTMDNPDEQFRPGMKGDATVYGPVRPLAWAYVRPWYERLLWAIGY